MARIKYYNTETSSWEYADTSSATPPIKGIDYWTDNDKQEIVSDVLAALPNASGVDF